MDRPVSMKVWLITLAIMLAVLFILSGVIQHLKSDRVEKETMLISQKDVLEGTKQEREEVKEYSTSDAYIEFIARTEYGYIFPNEVRIVFDNPEALYENGVTPSP